MHFARILRHNDNYILLCSFFISHRFNCDVFGKTLEILAVINIITKDASDIGGVRVTSGYGSFNTYEENVIFGEKYGKVNVSGMLHYRQTDGFDGILGRDRQTTLDGKFGTSASNAPGNVQDGRQEFAMNLKVEYNDLWFHGWYNNKNRDTFIGPQYALSDESDIENNYVFGEIGYKKVFNERLTMCPRIYYDQFDIRETVIPNVPFVREKRMGIGFELRYSIFALLNFDILFTLINGMSVITASPKQQ